MKVSLLYCLVALAALFGVGLYRRAWLLPVWLVSFLVFPTAHAKVGEAPIYLYDLVTVLVIVVFGMSGEFKSWPRHAPRWHWWFISLSFLSSVVFGFVRYGMMPELIWIWGHTALSWMSFAFGVIILTSSQSAAYRQALQWGILASVVALVGLAIIQYLDLPQTGRIAEFFYGDIGAVASVELLRVGPATNRATGPHFAPTTFSGMALLSAIIYWQITTHRQRWLRGLVILICAGIILCTVSRHAMLAAVAGVFVMIAMSETRRRVKLITIGAVMAMVAGVFAAGFILKQSWTERLSRLNEGVLEDENIAARVIAGPARLAEAIGQDPTLLLTGAGLEPEKMSVKTGKELSFGSGFVSNGFLLALYYLGIPGFVMFGMFWVWTFYASARLPARLRGYHAGFVGMAAVIVAADNYSFMYEPAESLLFLLAGLIAGQLHQCRVEAVQAARAAAEPEPEPPAQPRESYAA